MADEGVELLERARVEQLVDPLAGRQLALLVLLLDRLLRAGVERLVAELAQIGELLVVGDRVLLSHVAESRDGVRSPERRLEERAAAVLAEDVSHRVADLADRAAGT